MTISTVTVVGANGNLGGPVLHALLESGRFRVSVLRRASSRSVAEGEQDGRVAVLPVADDAWGDSGAAAAAAAGPAAADPAVAPPPALVHALRGQDAVVVCFPLRSLATHLAIARAAAAAGVRRYIPADFGSVDARSARARALVPLFEKKETVRALLQGLVQAAGASPFSFTNLVGGHFFDWGLHHNFLHINLDTHVSDVVLGDGSGPRSSLTTLARYGEAVVRVLSIASAHGGSGGSAGADPTANRVLFLQSFCVSQNELQAAVERATAGAGKAWTVIHRDTDAYIAERKAKADAGDLDAIEDLVFALGVLEGDWTTKGDEYAMGLLGFEDEDLDTVVDRVVAEHKPKK